MGAVQRVGMAVEEQASATDYHATAPSPCAASREDLH